MLGHAQCISALLAPLSTYIATHESFLTGESRGPQCPHLPEHQYISVLAYYSYLAYNNHMDTNKYTAHKTVSSAEFQKNIGHYQDVALTEAVTITRNGRARVVLISVDEYARLQQRDRQALAAHELDAEQIAALEGATMPEGLAHLDAELD